MTQTSDTGRSAGPAPTSSASPAPTPRGVSPEPAAAPDPLPAPGAPLAGNLVLVTGASRGIGAHLARHLAAAGADLALVARSAHPLRELGDHLRADHGVRVVALPADVTDRDRVEAVVEQVCGELGVPDAVVNNAGVIDAEVPLWEADPTEWWRVMEVDVLGPFLVSRALSRIWIERGTPGKVINISSGAAVSPSGVSTAYHTAKTALARITGGLALAGAPHGIRAFDLAPGVVRTDMTLGAPMHAGRTEWTDPARICELVEAAIAGRLDAWSGRHLRAGTDDPQDVESIAPLGRERDLGLVTPRPGDRLDPMARR